MDLFSEHLYLAFPCGFNPLMSSASVLHDDPLSPLPAPTEVKPSLLPAPSLVPFQVKTHSFVTLFV